MPGTTFKGFPFPQDTDPVSNGAEAIRGLAQFAEAYVGLHESGKVTVNTPDTTARSIAVSFDQPFTSTPRVVVALEGVSNPSAWYSPTVAGVTATGCTVWVQKLSAGAAGSVDVNWHASQCD